MARLRHRLLRFVALVGVALLLTSCSLIEVDSPLTTFDPAGPNADRIDGKTFVLHDEQVERIEARMRGSLDHNLAKVYTAMEGGDILGYAIIDVHEVRTLPEAVMVVLTPSGEVRSLRVLAFHEPLEYLPTERWYRQFEKHTLAEPLRLGGDIHGVVGSTLTTRATTKAVRRALAYYEVLVAEGDALQPASFAK